MSTTSKTLDEILTEQQKAQIEETRIKRSSISDPFFTAVIQNLSTSSDLYFDNGDLTKNTSIEDGIRILKGGGSIQIDFKDFKDISMVLDVSPTSDNFRLLSI